MRGLGFRFLSLGLGSTDECSKTVRGVCKAKLRRLLGFYGGSKDFTPKLMNGLLLRIRNNGCVRGVLGLACNLRMLVAAVAHLEVLPRLGCQRAVLGSW